MPTKEELSAVRRENLSHLIDERFDGVQARFASAIGKPSNYVWRLLTDGPHAKGIGEEIARLIEERLGLDQYALDKSKARGRQQHTTMTAAPPVNQSAAPRSISVVQSSAIDALHGKPTAGWVRKHGIAEVFVSESLSDEAFALTVPDHSMTPNFLLGEMLVFDPAIEPEAGDYVLARVRGGVLFRRYRPAQGREFMLDAVNEDYAPVWSDRDQIMILGVLVEHHRTRSARQKQTPQ